MPIVLQVICSALRLMLPHFCFQNKTNIWLLYLFRKVPSLAGNSPSACFMRPGQQYRYLAKRQRANTAASTNFPLKRRKWKFRRWLIHQRSVVELDEGSHSTEGQNGLKSAQSGESCWAALKLIVVLAHQSGTQVTVWYQSLMSKL